MSLYTPCSANNKTGRACHNEAKKNLILCFVHHKVYEKDKTKLALQAWTSEEYKAKKSIFSKDYEAIRFVREPKDVVKTRKRVRDFLRSSNDSIDLPPMNRRQRHRLYSRFTPGKKVHFEVTETQGDNKKLRVTKKTD